MPIFFHLPTTTNNSGESLPPFVSEFPRINVVIQVPHGCLPVLGEFYVDDGFFHLANGEKTVFSREMFSGSEIDVYDSIFFMCPVEYLRAMGVS